MGNYCAFNSKDSVHEELDKKIFIKSSFKMTNRSNNALS